MSDIELRRMIRLGDITDMIGVHRTTIYRWIERGQFPRPIALGDQVVAFYLDEVIEWQQKREQQRAAPKAKLPPIVRRRDAAPRAR